MKIFYENHQAKATHDITSAVLSAKWSTYRTVTPAKLELTCEDISGVEWVHGGRYTLMDGERGLFFGFGASMSRTEEGEVSITAYDQLFYLKSSKDTYVGVNKKAGDILSDIAQKFGRKLGVVTDTGYVIPSIIKQGKSMLDVLLEALDLTLIHTGRIFMLWDDFGELRISDVEELKLGLTLGDESLATGYTYASNIENDTYNRIKLVRENKDTARRDAYLFEDLKNIALWGLLQEYESVDEGLNEAQITARGEQLLELKNRPVRSFDISAMSDSSCRAGCSVLIDIGDIGVRQFFLIDEASHNLLDGTMELSLRVV